MPRLTTEKSYEHAPQMHLELRGHELRRANKDNLDDVGTAWDAAGRYCFSARAALEKAAQTADAPARDGC